MNRLDRRSFVHGCGAAWAMGVGGWMMGATKAQAADGDFQAQQQRRREELWGLLGELPRGRAVGPARKVKSEQRDGYTLEHLELDLNGSEPVPAFLLLPDRRAEKAPGLVYIHAHGGTYGQGKEELIEGRKVLPAYAPLLAALGIVTLAIDSWCFSGRKHQIGRAHV